MLVENIRDIIQAYRGPFNGLRKHVEVEVAAAMRRGFIPPGANVAAILDEEVTKFLKEVETRSRDAAKKQCNARKANRKRGKR